MIQAQKLTPLTLAFAAIALITVALSIGLDGANAAPGKVEAPALKKANFPGMPPAGKATSLSVHAGHTNLTDANKPTTIVGPDARAQLIVTSKHQTGQLRDQTRSAKYTATPTGIVNISSSGLVTPLKNGQVTINILGPDGTKTKTNLTVKYFDNPPALNFSNDIVPLFTKYGCNGGGCHGKSGGQNGFRLSLLGFEPWNDYEYLVNEGRGRRLFPAAPDHSLLLLKAVNTLPHGGGQKIKPDSADYRVLRRWIAQGTPYGSKNDPTIVDIDVFPKKRTLPHDGAQQLMVVATYSDGSTREVTQTAQYEPNDKDMATVSEDGKVTLLGRPGDVGIMVRYQARVAVFNATVPLGIPVKNLPKPKNLVDTHVFNKLKELGMPPSKKSTDATFIRRVTLDLCGRIPTAEEARQFAEDKSPDKRDKLIDRLLKSNEFADYFANKWSSILRNKREKNNQRMNYAFHAWIRAAIKNNMPYDRFVRGILASSGEVSRNPGVAWYNHVNKKNEQVEDSAQMFLGVRIQCARCHHHPFDIWGQKDYYQFEAFFSRVGKKPGVEPGQSSIYHLRGTPSSRHPKTGKALKPAGLAAKPLDIDRDTDPRQKLVDWMADPKNPYFAKMLVNRYWKHFFGRGLVEPEDDLRLTNPPVNPELMDALAKSFIQSKFDTHKLIRQIVSSNVYQFSALPNQYNVKDTQAFSRYYPKRLNAEVLLDSINQLTGTTTRFAGLPAGARAIQIPDHGGVNSYFLTVFGRPAGASACECERTIDASLAQSLHLINSQDIHNKLKTGRAKKLAAGSQGEDEAKITELYFIAFSRAPSNKELDVAMKYLARFPKNRPEAYEDIVWALMNTKEFLFNH